MEKINIAELLKDCPKGMELDCTMYEDVKFISVEENDKPICIRTGDIYRYLTKFGTWTFDENAKCVIFPKGKTTWEGFQRPFKDGEVIVYDNPYREHLQIFIFKDKKGNNTLSTCYLMLDGDELDLEEGSYYATRIATEDEKQKLFQAIKDNGYKWNEETKTLEKLVEPKFKVGDRVRHKETNKDDVYEISKVYDGSYGLVGFSKMIYMKYQDQYELVPNKFDITTLKPFDKVLVRYTNKDYWKISMFGYISNYDKKYFMCIDNSGFYQCIPFEGNEHLLGTTNDCDDYYKTWK